MYNIKLLAKDFCEGNYDFNVPDCYWTQIFTYIVENHNELIFSRDLIHSLWIVNGGHLRRKIKNDYLISKVLTLSFPGYYGKGLTLYRGECCFLYESNLIGFCWTPNIEVARKFASGLNSIESGGILLKAFAPAISILSGPNEHSKNMEEFEYTCNPYLLENIQKVCIYDKYKS
jgi:hypothetical protein